MAMNFTGYANDFNVFGAVSSLPWSNPANCLGVNAGPSAASVITDEKSFTTQSYFAKLSESSLITFLNENPTLAYIKFEINYQFFTSASEVVLTPEEEAQPLSSSVSIQTYLTTDGVDLGVSSQSKNTTSSPLNNTTGNRTASFVFFDKNIPDISSMTEGSFGIVFSFNGSNRNRDIFTIKVFQITMSIQSSTGVSYVQLFDSMTGRYYESGEALDIKYVAKQSLIPLKIKNAGDKSLAINSNGVGFNGNKSLAVDNTFSQKVTISPNKTVSFSLNSIATSLGDFNNNLFVSGDQYNSSFNVDIPIFTTSINPSVPTTNGLISFSYNENEIKNNSFFSLASFPIGVSKVVSIKIKNASSSQLNIRKISIIGDGSIFANSLTDGSVINANQEGFILLDLNTNLLGNKLIEVYVGSEAFENSVFIFTLNFSVLSQSKIEFLNASNIALVNNSRDELGTVDKNRDLTKSYTLKNSGIYRSIIINSISSTNQDLLIINNKPLPFTLLPNNVNSLTFSIDFDTDNVGLKESSLVIDYSDGNIV